MACKPSSIQQQLKRLAAVGFEQSGFAPSAGMTYQDVLAGAARCPWCFVRVIATRRLTVGLVLLLLIQIPSVCIVQIESRLVCICMHFAFSHMWPCATLAGDCLQSSPKDARIIIARFPWDV